MKTTKLIMLFESALLTLLLALQFHVFHPQKVFSATSHVVISQIQIGATGNTNQEFVELYNPTTAAVDLRGWRLIQESSSGSTHANLVNSMSGAIGAHGYFLVANPHYVSATIPMDLPYSAFISRTSCHLYLEF